MSLKSSTGLQLERAQQFSEDEHGKRIPKRERLNWHEMRVKSTRAYAPAPTALEDTEEEAQRQKDERELRALLTDDENRIRDMQKLRFLDEVVCEAPVDAMARLLDEGWCLVRQENGVATLTMETHTWLTYDEIGARLCLSASQVHRRVKSMNKKLRGAR